MKNKVLKSIAALVFGYSVALGSTANAAPITGTFSLVNDRAGVFFAPGQLLASGSFVTKSKLRKKKFDVDGVLFNTVGIESMKLLDQSGGFFPDFIFPNDSETSVRNLFAIVDNDDPERILGFNGTIRNRGSKPNGKVTFFGPRMSLTPGAGIVSSFYIEGKTASNGLVGESGVQAVPEPGALPLLASGLLAFGVVSRRRINRKKAAA